MKTVLVFVLTLVSLVYGQDRFRFPNNKSACILASFGASIELTLTEGNETKSVPVNLPAVKEVNVNGSCSDNTTDTSTLTLTFHSGDYDLSFTFSEKNKRVSAELQFVVIHPNVTFKNFNYSESVSLTETGADFNYIGNTNQSYLCKAQDNITLVSDQKEGFNISATFVFSDLQIQGFGVKNGTFSEPDECSADKSTTPASTTPASTTPGSTTPMPPAGIYTVGEGNNTCLRMDATIVISVSYNDTKGKLVNRKVTVPADAESSGICGAKKISLNLAVEDKAVNETSGNLSFVFIKMEKYSFISSIDFSLDFSDANETVTGSNDDTNNALSLSDQYFVCKDETFMLQKDEVELKNLKVQAFDLPGGNFSTKGLDCKKPPPATPTKGNYSVTDNNITCISMVAAITLQVNYVTNGTTNKTLNVNFEKDQPAVGQCSSGNETAEFIIVKYKDLKFQAELQFAKETKVSSTLGADTFTFYVENITVTYTLDPIIFADAINPGEKHTFSLTNQKLYSTSSDKYYLCASETTIDINPSVKLVTKDLRLVAFNTDPKNPNLSGDNAEECAADNETNSVVPIAVGAALAGLVVIVLIAYLIGRRRNRKGYESV